MIAWTIGGELAGCLRLNDPLYGKAAIYQRIHVGTERAVVRSYPRPHTRRVIRAPKAFNEIVAHLAKHLTLAGANPSRAGRLEARMGDTKDKPTSGHEHSPHVSESRSHVRYVHQCHIT